jgi:agmatinase
MRRASEMEHVERIVQVGMRGIGSARQGEWDDARDWGAQIVTARAIARHGVAPVLDMLPEGSDVVVALDCDGLDPSIMPSVIARTPGGLGYWDVIELLDGVAGKARLVGFEMAEFVAEADIDGLGALTAGRIVTNVARIAAWA